MLIKHSSSFTENNSENMKHISIYFLKQRQIGLLNPCREILWQVLDFVHVTQIAETL